MEEAVRADLIGKPNLQELTFFWSTSREGLNKDEKVLKGLQPHPNMKSLTILKYSGDNFPSWTMNMIVQEVNSLENLIDVKLVDCERCLEVPTLGHLPLLKTLWLDGLKNVESIGPSFYYPHDSIESRSSGSSLYSPPTPFRALEYFKLRKMKNLVEWVAVKDSTTTLKANGFPSLKFFQIDRCKNLVTIPNHDFPSLEVVHLCDCRNLTDILFLEDNEPMQFLKELTIARCSSLKSIGNTSGGLQGLASLRGLSISDCPNSFTVDWQGMPHISNVSFDKCPNWRSFSQDIGCLRSLTFLSVGFSPDDFDMLKQTLHCIRGLTSLRHLRLYGCEEWDSLPDQLQHLTNITYLHLESFGVEVLPEWFGDISTLEILCLDNCFELRQLPSKEAMQRLTKFKKLNILDCPLLKDKNEYFTTDKGWL